MGSGRDPVNVQRETNGMGFFVKSHRKSDEPYTSFLMHRDSTMKSRGIEHPYEQDLESFNSLVVQECKVKDEMEKTKYHSLVPPKKKKELMEKEKELGNKFHSIKKERHHVQKKYRCLKSKFKEGITGIEQPGDINAKDTKKPSKLYQAYNKQLQLNKKL